MDGWMTCFVSFVATSIKVENLNSRGMRISKVRDKRQQTNDGTTFIYLHSSIYLSIYSNAIHTLAC
jgi:hypothetical protein